MVDVHTLVPDFVHPCEVICASFSNDVVSVWSQDFYILHLIVQTLWVPLIVWNLLLRRNQTFFSELFGYSHGNKTK